MVCRGDFEENRISFAPHLDSLDQAEPVRGPCDPAPLEARAVALGLQAGMRKARHVPR